MLVKNLIFRLIFVNTIELCKINSVVFLIVNKLFECLENLKFELREYPKMLDIKV